MKTPNVMKQCTNGIVSRHGAARPAHSWLIASLACILAAPCWLSAQTLQHRYSFVSDASDSVGTANGTIVAPSGGSAVTIANGLTLPGGGGPGFSGYVNLPSGILTTTTNLTVECWVTQNSQNTWAELWSFNNGTSEYFGFIPYPANNNNNMAAAFRTSNNENDASSTKLFPNGAEQYLAVTVNANTLIANLYTNGGLIASTKLPSSAYVPGNYGGGSGTINNFLGQDPWPDPQFQGTIYEFRIWNGVVSQRYLSASALVGPGTIINNLTPTSVSISAGNSLVISGTEQASVTVQLPQTGSAPLLATSDATNWVSSNPSVVQVNSAGLITGVGVGTATVSAKVGGITGTTSTITVTGPQQLIHRYSFVSDASDSVGTANGTIVTPGNANGTNVLINNGLVLSGGGGNDYSGYVSLPAGILTNTTSVTVECWLTQNTANTWATPWDFANNGSQNFALITSPGNNNHHTEVAFTPHGNEVDVQSSITFPNGSEQYVALTYNNSTLAANLYTNGALIGSATMPDTSYCPGAIGGGLNINALGNDIYGDTQFQGTIYEFRIWNGSVSPAYIAESAVAGPNVIITNETPQSLSIVLTNTSMVGASTQPAAVMGNFIQVSGVNVTGAATNWVSSNPNVLTVNSSGLITAVNGGTATVSATVGGVSATSAAITVATTKPFLTQLPVSLNVAVNDTATFSVAALGGSLSYQWSHGASPITGATNTTLVLNNVQLSSAGTYTVTVSNNLGSTNVSATLNVQQAILQHRYSFVSDASDSVGGANGTLVAPTTGTAATIANGLSLPGSGGGGVSGYVSLPANILTNTTSITVECWVTQNSPNTWSTVWDFGNDGSHNFEYCPAPASGRNGGNPIVAFTPHGNEVDLNAPTPFLSGVQQYVVLTYTDPSLLGKLYTNGVLESSVTLPDSSYRPASIGGGTTQNMLGNNVYGDPQFNGTVYEFRIWDGAVSPLYIALAQAAGPGVVVTNLSPLSISVTVANSSMIQGQSQPASATGNFSVASGVDVTGAVTNWSSSNPSVLTVNSNGVIVAVGTGSATISATVNGVTGTSSSITVPNNAPVITQDLPASESLLVGASLNLSVGAIGTAPFTYYWFTNSSTVPISVTTTPTLTVPNLQLAASANYYCIVSNIYGTATSATMALTVAAPTTYEQAMLSYGPIAFWPLNETSGTTAYDVIGGNNGTYTGGCALGQTGPGNTFFGASSFGVTVDGSSGYVDIPGANFNITNAMSVVVWIQLSANNGFDGVIGKGDPSWRISVNGSGVPGANDGSAPADANAINSINDSSWHMLAYTYNGFVGKANNGALYVDGVLVGNNTISVPPPGDNLDVWIGGAPDYGTGAGKRLVAATLANAAVFSQPLTAAQVTGMYNGTFVAAPNTLSLTDTGSGPVLNWQVGTLLQAPSLLGPWTTNYSAIPPYTVPATNSSQFFKLQIKP